MRFPPLSPFTQAQKNKNPSAPGQAQEFLWVGGSIHLSNSGVRVREDKMPPRENICFRDKPQSKAAKPCLAAARHGAPLVASNSQDRSGEALWPCAPCNVGRKTFANFEAEGQQIQELALDALRVFSGPRSFLAAGEPTGLHRPTVYPQLDEPFCLRLRLLYPSLPTVELDEATLCSGLPSTFEPLSQVAEPRASAAPDSRDRHRGCGSACLG